jgi:hypothetical protein
MSPGAAEWYQRKNDEQVDALAKQIREHIETELRRDAMAEEQFVQMSKQVLELSGKVSTLIDMLAQMRGALAFIKVLAALVAAGAAAWAWIMSNIQGLAK